MISLTEMKIIGNLSMLSWAREHAARSTLYALEAILDTAIAVTFILALGTAAGFLPEMAVFLTVFIILRHVTLGYCASSYILFLLAMTAVTVGLMGFLILLPEELLNQLTILLSLLSVALIARYGVITPEDKTRSFAQAVRFQRTGRIIAAALAAAVIGITFAPGCLSTAFAGAYSLILAGVLLYVSTLRNKQARSWNPPLFWVSWR